MNELQKAAEILVECGYADDVNENHTAHAHQCGKYGDDVSWELRPIEFDKDTLEGRRQADAIEDYLHQNFYYLVCESKEEIKSSDVAEYNGRQKRIDRIKWCLQELSK